MRVVITLDIPTKEVKTLASVSKSTMYRISRNGKDVGKQWENLGKILNVKVLSAKVLPDDFGKGMGKTWESNGKDKESERKEESSPHTPFIEEKKGKEREAPCSGVQSENIKFSSVHPCPPRDEGERGDFLSHENFEKGKIPVILGSKKGLFPIVVSGVMPKKPQKDFVPPTVAEVEARIAEKRYNVDAEEFVAFYASKGWMVGKNRMKDWRMALVTWQKGAERRKTEHYGNDRTDSWGKRRAAPVIASSAEEYEGAF